MGQKVHPIGFRLGVYRNWDARWYADKDYTALLHEDIAIRRLVGGRLATPWSARIETEQRGNELTVTIQTAKPGIVIGKQGASVDALRDELEKITAKKVRVTIHRSRRRARRQARRRERGLPAREAHRLPARAQADAAALDARRRQGLQDPGERTPRRRRDVAA